MAQLEPGIPVSPQQEALPSRRQSPDLNIRSSRQPAAVEGKEAIVHDFLSLGGSKSAPSIAAVAPNGLQSSISTQNLLQPLRKTAESNNALPAKPHMSSTDYNAGQQTAYNLVNGGVEMHPNYRSSDFSCLPKAHTPQGVSNNKHWQQQKKKLTFVVSDDEDDDEDESLDHGYNSKKDIGYQKFDNAQHPDGKSMDSKGLTPRSKHSATEQRRRSKINDRFQMLRQLLPNADQKRDKASFLLEVIEHIQMLHDKVKKYEAAEHLRQLQEIPEALPWDRMSGCKEGVIDVSYNPSLPSLTYNKKDPADANGYTRYQSSTSRVGHGGGITHVELISSSAHASPYANRLLQSPTCLASYENGSLSSKPALLTFATPPSIYGEEPATPTLFLSSSQLLPEARTMFVQPVHQEEQAAIRVKYPHSNEEAAIALPDVQPAGKSLSARKSSFLHDGTDCEKRGSPENRPRMHNDGRADEEIDEQLRSSSVKDHMHQRNVVSISKECRNDKGRASYGFDDTPMDMNVKKLRGECRGDAALSCDQGTSAFLGGTVNISSPYSQGLLDSLTRALQRSGVDLSQASISVQVDLGKRSGSAITSSTEIATLNTAMRPFHLQESEHSAKRPKIDS